MTNETNELLNDEQPADGTRKSGSFSSFHDNRDAIFLHTRSVPWGLGRMGESIMKKLFVSYLTHFCLLFPAAVFALYALATPVAAYEQEGEHEGQYGDDERDSDDDGELNCEDCDDGNDADGDGRDYDKRDNDSDNWWNCEDDDDGQDDDGDGMDNDNNDADNDGEENCEDDNDGIDWDGDGQDYDVRTLTIFPQGGEDGEDGEGGAGSCSASTGGDWWALSGAVGMLFAAAVVRTRRA